MTKKIKTLLSLGVITIVTASNMVPANALVKIDSAKFIPKGVSYLCINGVKYKFPVNSNCINKPSAPGTATDKNEYNSGSTEKPVTTPDNNQNNSGSTEKPATTSDNNQNNSVSTEKPDSNTGNNEQSAGNFAAFQQEVLRLVNIERNNRGISSLVLNSSLSNVATMKSQDMINKNYFDHNSPTYGSPFDMMKQFGISYKTAGENIAMGQSTPKEVVTAWMNSEGHRKNILNSSFTDIGVGVAKNSNGTIYWTQMFIGK
ncbi:sporulation protein [Romboutsia maritimum]|uniref:Sporulation protein n=1 Tax=Romboutsia maritimum TaxID=2020948 RepID=A0A371ITQ4_9FIRM|nr:CAP domain-containing protein [Romboutsia maritimum]RDY23862.1 sporulation protein [Romboutsia maritimum]